MDGEIVSVLVGMLVGLAIVLVAGFLAFMAFSGYVLHRWMRIQEAESGAIEQTTAPVPDAEEGAGDEEERVLSLINRAKNGDRMYVEAWREEKLTEGWTEQDVEDYLANREPIELN